MAEACANRTHPRRSSRLATALKAAGPTREPSVSIGQLVYAIKQAIAIRKLNKENPPVIIEAQADRFVAIRVYPGNAGKWVIGW